MQRSCQQENCTVDETRVCLLNNELSACPHLVRHEASAVEGEQSLDLSPPLSEPPKKALLPPSLTLSIDSCQALMAHGYHRMVGILGAPDAGKTASLVSLYLLVSSDRLAGFKYANSRSLMSLELISRGARRWNEGELPDQMTSHTEMADDRTAGFVHLKLVAESNGEPIDLLLPDLPGEWSTAFIDSNRADRLQFLKRCDVIWVMVDGRQIASPATRQYGIHRARVLIQRLAELVSVSTPLILVVTRADQEPAPEGAVQTICSEATRLGFDIEVISIASFSDPASGVQPGSGISQLIAATSRPTQSSASLWPIVPTGASPGRMILRFSEEMSR